MRTLDLRHIEADIDITVLVTCYNEEKYITDTLDSVMGALFESRLSYEVIVIDDVSTDNSVQRVEEYIQNHPEYSITFYVNKKNHGLGYNYIEGAFLGSGKYYRLCCGDNVESKELLVYLFNHVGMADMIIPYHSKENELPGKNFFRRLLSKTFSFLVNFLSGYNIIYYNGLPIHLRYDVMRWGPSSYGFGFQADLITQMLDQGATYCQVPVYGIRHTKKEGIVANVLSMRNVLSVGHTLLEVLIRRVVRGLYNDHKPKPVEVALGEESSAKKVANCGETHDGIVDKTHG